MGSYPILTPESPIVFFDSNCLLCNKSVQFLLKHDKREILSFAGLSSDYGKTILSEYSIEEDSVVLYFKKEISVKSSAFLKICSILGFPYKLILIFYIVPPFIRNGLYDLIASNRKRWFGTTNQCIIDTSKYPNRILG